MPPQCTVPIFLAAGDGRFREWGTGTLLTYHERPVMLTAAHVVDGEGDQDTLLSLCAAPYLAELPHGWHETPLPPNGTHTYDDNLDVAVVVVGDDLATDLIQLGFVFLPEAWLDHQEITGIDVLVYSGFPGNQQECHALENGTWVDLQPVAIHTRRAPYPAYEGLGRIAEENIVARYHAINGVAGPFPPGAPMPPGMSGGAVFRYENGVAVSLVGIIQRWNPGDYFVSTRFGPIMHLLDAAVQQ